MTIILDGGQVSITISCYISDPLEAKLCLEALSLRCPLLIWWAWPDPLNLWAPWLLLYFVVDPVSLSLLTTLTDEDFLELDSLDLSDPDDLEEALRDGWEPRLSVGVAEFRPSAAAASALSAELK